MQILLSELIGIIEKAIITLLTANIHFMFRVEHLIFLSYIIARYL